MKDDFVPNRPTPEGRALGAEVARLTDAAEAEQRKQFPNMRERCSSCAFRAGTLPNGCEETLMDAVKAVMQMDTFSCHMHLDADRKPTQPCVGWLLLCSQQKERRETPWEYAMVPDVGGPG